MASGCRDDGMADFYRIRYRHHDADVFLYAFDLIELNGDDLRHDPLQVLCRRVAKATGRAMSAASGS
jgi:ATP-dependent DNA ligase